MWRTTCTFFLFVCFFKTYCWWSTKSVGLINEICRCDASDAIRMPLCSIASLSLPCISDNALKDRRSVKGGRDEPFRPWKKDLVADSPWILLRVSLTCSFGRNKEVKVPFVGSHHPSLSLSPLYFVKKDKKSFSECLEATLVVHNALKLCTKLSDQTSCRFILKTITLSI